MQIKWDKEISTPEVQKGLFLVHGSMAVSIIQGKEKRDWGVYFHPKADQLSFCFLYRERCETQEQAENIVYQILMAIEKCHITLLIS